MEEIMKKVTALVLTVAMVFIVTACSGNDETTSGEKVNTGIIIEYDANWFMNKYDVNISVDDSDVANIKQGEKELYELTLTEGTHTLTFSELGNDKNLVSKEFEVTADNYYYFFIKAENNGIEIQKTDTMTLDGAFSFVGKSAQEEVMKETFLALSFDVPVAWRKVPTDSGVKYYPTNNDSDGFLYIGVREIGTIAGQTDEMKRAAIDSQIEVGKKYDGFLDNSVKYDLEIAGNYAVKEDSAWTDYNCVYYYTVINNTLYLIGIDITLDSPDNLKDILDNVIASISINETNDTVTPSKPAGDGSQAIYEDAIGKKAIDIYNKLESLGYKVSFTHAVTKADFTSAVQYESDPDSESYIPWLITDVDSYNVTSKTASFFINTQERIDEAQSQSTAEDTLQAKLDASVAWGTVEYYGNSEYPYGFKLKIATGMLAETAVDDNTWFLKAQCEVKNEYGTWMKNLVCEARVSGTTESPQIDYFEVY